MCLFCDFISGERKEHINGFPFEILNETKHCISFLSIDLPKRVDGHILVIPKKHFSDIDDMPKDILGDLMYHTAKAAKALKRKYPASNIFLNNGGWAGQTVPHVHFHVLPRINGDNAKFEIWDRKKMKKEEFQNLSSKLKKHFD